MGNPSVVMSAGLMCSFGMAPSSMLVVRPNVLINKLPAATIMDIAPMSNIPPFAMCTSLANPTVAAATAAALGVLTPMPCVPTPVGPWKPGAPTTLIGNMPALVAGSVLNCAYAGVISITMPGSTTVTAA